MVVSWIPWVLLAAAMCAVWVFTTYFWLRLARVPAPAAFAATPAATAGLIWATSILWYRAGWFWSGARVLPVLAAFGAIGLILFVTRKRRSGPARPRYRMRFLSAGFAGAATLGWLLAALPTMIAAPPDNPPQQWDPSFHLNGVWGITQLGIAAPGPGLAHNFGGAAASGYPTGWHAFTSLFATATTTVSAANASSLALMFVWVVGVAVYSYTLYPSRRVALAGAVIAGILPSMPADALTLYSQWPNAASVAFLPGGATVVVLLGRAVMQLLRIPIGTSASRAVLPLRAASASTTALLLVATLAITAGGLQAHQVYAFNLLVLLTPPLVIGTVTLMVVSARNRNWAVFCSTVAAAVGALALLTLVQFRPEVASMRNYPRSGVDIGTGLSQALVPNPPFTITFGLGAYNTLVSVILLLGIVRILWGYFGRASTSGRSDRDAEGPVWAPWPGQSRPLLWPIWSYLLFALLVFVAYGPDWTARTWIVGPWFNDGRRIMEPMSVALVPLLTVGFGWVAGWAVNLWNMRLGPGTVAQQRWVSWAVGAALILGSGFGAMDARILAARAVLDPQQLGKSGMADQETLDLMRELPHLIPEDAVVLGDPQAGAMYSQVIGQRWAYFPQLSLLNADRDTQGIIVNDFRYLTSDPQVCEAIATAGITHYLERPDGAYYGRLRSDRMPGVYGVDTSVGFELVASAGQTRLYEITACESQ